MKKTIFAAVIATLACTLFSDFTGAAPAKNEENSEDYKILKEIIVTEFSQETPHEWGDSVSGVKTHLKTGEKVLAIGVDACGRLEKGIEMELIRFFQTENIPATLFVCGDWIDGHREVLRKLAANPLFEIANHGVSQKPCSISGKSADGKVGTKNVEEVFSEVEKNARQIESVTGSLPQYYRAGAGYYDEVAVRIIKALGYEAVGANIKLPEGKKVTRKQVLDALLNPSAGAIAILQSEALNRSVFEGVAEAVRKLRARGYKFVRLSDYILE